MTEKWKNVECSYWECQDREEQARLREELSRVTEDRDKLYKDIENLRLIMDKKDVSEDQINKLIQDNLNLRRNLLNKEGILNKQHVEIITLQQEISALQSTMKEREERDLRQIKELSNLDIKAKETTISLDKNKNELYMSQKELEVLRSFIKEAKDEIKYIKDERDILNKEMAHLKDDSLVYRLECKHYKQFFTRRTKKLQKLLKKILQKNDRKKTELAQKLYARAKEKYLSLTSVEMRLIGNDFNDISKIMEK